MNIGKLTIAVVTTVASLATESIVEDGVKILINPMTVKKTTGFAMKIGTGIVASAIAVFVSSAIEKQITEIVETVRSVDNGGDTIVIEENNAESE